MRRGESPFPRHSSPKWGYSVAGSFHQVSALHSYYAVAQVPASGVTREVNVVGYARSSRKARVAAIAAVLFSFLLVGTHVAFAQATTGTDDWESF